MTSSPDRPFFFATNGKLYLHLIFYNSTVFLIYSHLHQQKVSRKRHQSADWQVIPGEWSAENHSNEHAAPKRLIKSKDLKDNYLKKSKYFKMVSMQAGLLQNIFILLICFTKFILETFTVKWSTKVLDKLELGPDDGARWKDRGPCYHNSSCWERQ